MSLLGKVLGAAAVVSVLPVKVSVEKVGEEGNVHRKISINAMLYDVDIDPQKTAEGDYSEEKSVKVSFPGMLFHTVSDAVRAHAHFKKKKAASDDPPVETTFEDVTEQTTEEA